MWLGVLALAAGLGRAETGGERLALAQLIAEGGVASAQITCAPGSPLEAAPDGPLSGVVRRLLDRPKALRSLLDNSLIVALVMSTDRAHCNCKDPAALRAYLANPDGPVKEMLPTVEAVLDRPETAAALLGSELAARMLGCRGIRTLARDPAALAQLRAANPRAYRLIDDPRVERALAASPQALEILAAARAHAAR